MLVKDLIGSQDKSQLQRFCKPPMSCFASAQNGNNLWSRRLPWFVAHRPPCYNLNSRRFLTAVLRSVSHRPGWKTKP